MTPDKVEAALGVFIEQMDILRDDFVRYQEGEKSVPFVVLRESLVAALNAYDGSNLSVLAEALAERGWRPIDSAPRDGTQVLLYTGNVGAIRGYWDCDKYSKAPRPYWTNDWERIGGRLETRANQPTHWQPLPEPPHDR